MSTAKVTLEFDAKYESLVRRALAFAEEMDRLALTAPDGVVFDVCEQAVIDQGRKLQAQVLSDAVTRRIEAAEKKGRRSAAVSADAAKKIAAPKADIS
jgi:hypothetical protein